MIIQALENIRNPDEILTLKSVAEKDGFQSGCSSEMKVIKHLLQVKLLAKAQNRIISLAMNRFFKLYK